MNRFYDLPEDLQYYIWKIYFNENVIKRMDEPLGPEEISHLYCRDDYNESTLYKNNFTIWNGYEFDLHEDSYNYTYDYSNDLGTKESPYQISYRVRQYLLCKPLFDYSIFKF